MSLSDFGYKCFTISGNLLKYIFNGPFRNRISESAKFHNSLPAFTIRVLLLMVEQKTGKKSLI